MNNIYNIWFARVDVTNSIKAKLYQKFSVEEIFYFTEKDFINQGLKPVSAEKFLDKKYRINLEKYMGYMNQNGITQIFKDDVNYPDKFRIIQNPPTYFFAKRQHRTNV